jgi:hypothetical protein
MNFAKGVYVVYPTYFTMNPESSQDDFFMKMPADKSADELADMARVEHNQFVDNLRDNGIRVTSFK